MKISLTLLLALLLPAVAYANPAAAVRNSDSAISLPGQAPNLAARAYLLFDHTTW